MTADDVPPKLSRATARQVIREIASDTAKIVTRPHAGERSEQRGITRRQIELCCQKGIITEEPFFNAHGNWQVTMQRVAAGEEIECAVAIEWRSRLLVITTYRTKR
jgi:hypothetical protein